MNCVIGVPFATLVEEVSIQWFFSQMLVDVLIMAVDLYVLQLSVVSLASFKFATKHFIFMNI